MAIWFLSLFPVYSFPRIKLTEIYPKTTITFFQLELSNNYNWYNIITVYVLEVVNSCTNKDIHIFHCNLFVYKALWYVLRIMYASISLLFSIRLMMKIDI